MTQSAPNRFALPFPVSALLVLVALVIFAVAAFGAHIAGWSFDREIALGLVFLSASFLL